MFVQLVLSATLLFFLLIALMLFYIRHQSKVPYYQFTQEQCVDLLSRSIKGVLPEQEWHIFIGMSIRGNESLEALREECFLIDESCVKGTHLVEGRHCMSFTRDGVHKLEKLLDEWQYKSDYTV